MSSFIKMKKEVFKDLANKRIDFLNDELDRNKREFIDEMTSETIRYGFLWLKKRNYTVDEASLAFERSKFWYINSVLSVKGKLEDLIDLCNADDESIFINVCEKDYYYVKGN